MHKNKNDDGSLNISGKKIKVLRKNLSTKTSQRLLAEKLQLLGIGLDKNTIQKIEAGERFVTDIELIAFAKVFGISVDDLLR